MSSKIVFLAKHDCSNSTCTLFGLRNSFFLSADNSQVIVETVSVCYKLLHYETECFQCSFFPYTSFFFSNMSAARVRIGKFVVWIGTKPK